MSDIPRTRKRQLGGELVIPALAVAFTLYFFTTIWDSPWTAQVNAFLIGGVLLLVCGIFFVRSFLLLRDGQGSLGFSNLITMDDIRTGRLGLFITTTLYCVLIDYGGFTLTTFAFLWLSMAILGHFRRLRLITIVSAIMSLGGWAVFIWAFETRFPRGWFETTMAAVLSNG